MHNMHVEKYYFELMFEQDNIYIMSAEGSTERAQADKLSRKYSTQYWGEVETSTK